MSEALVAESRSMETSCDRTKQQKADLRDYYHYRLSEFNSYHLVYIDESGFDERIGYRRTGWAPQGITPVQVVRLYSGQRYRVLLAYCQDGVLLSRVFRGSTDASMTEDFMKQLLHHCGRWPEPKSVLVFNSTFSRQSEWLDRMCLEAGVKLLYLPPYSANLNPARSLFAKLKTFMKRNWKLFEINSDANFKEFLQGCVDVVGASEKSAGSHFCRVGLTIEHH